MGIPRRIQLVPRCFGLDTQFMASFFTVSGEEREIRLVFNWCLSLFSHRSNREKTENREKRNQLYNPTKHTILEQIWA